MREITFHKVEGKGGGCDNTKLLVLDEPGQGGACHEYEVTYDGPPRPCCVNEKEGCAHNHAPLLRVSFQNGPIQEFGVNGAQQEHLLAIVIDRLRAFQAGPFACRTNALALTKCEEALMWLQARTRDRIARQVEGYNKA